MTDDPDKAIRLAGLIAMASASLGDEERGTRWLDTPNTALGGTRPIDMAGTPEGARVVAQVLVRIEFGIGF